LTEYSQTDEFFRGSIVESTHWMVLHRPVELAAVTGEVDFQPKPLDVRFHDLNADSAILMFRMCFIPVPDSLTVPLGLEPPIPAWCLIL
jgi:hypothetical protein